jgi:uncharacterized protein
MGDFIRGSKSSAGRAKRSVGGRWLRRISPALIALSAGCADKSFERLSPEPEGGTRALLPASAEAKPADDFVQLVVKDLDDVWGRNFTSRGKTYSPVAPSLLAGKECSGDSEPPCEASQIDLEFQRGLQERFGDASKAPQAYAIAHQMGHHVQRIMGIHTKVAELLAARPIAAYMVETQVELQADCFAGVWLRSTRDRELLPPMEVERALRQASELGKELFVKKKAGEKLAGESFTYAIARRRGYWFLQGFSSGRIEDCDPFSVE